MNWNQMEEEVVTDVSDIVIGAAAHDGTRVTHIAAIIQWQGKQIAHTAFAPTTIELINAPEIDGVKGETAGMSFLPDPKFGDWKEVTPIFLPKVSGTDTYMTDDMPLSYYVVADTPERELRAVCIPRRFNGGEIAWVQSEQQISAVEDYLAVAGVLKMEVKR
jgi:hypothetical protein